MSLPLKHLRILFFLPLLLYSCSTYKIAYKHTSKTLHKSGLELKEFKNEKFTITYWDSGGDKPVMILLHGFGASTQFQWYKQVKSLKDTYRLVLPNLIYFGGSTSSSPISSVADQVYAMQSLIEYLGIKTYTLCGVSYGGLVSAELALLNPKSIKKLILCDAPIKFLTEKDIQKTLEKYKINSLSELLVPSNHKKLKPLMSIAYLKPPSVPRFMFKSVYKNMYVTQADGQKRLLQSLENQKEFFAAKTYHYDFPVLLIWGEGDELIPITVGQELQKHIGENAKLIVIPKTAHMPCLEAPKKFNTYLLEN